AMKALASATVGARVGLAAARRGAAGAADSVAAVEAVAAISAAAASASRETVDFMASIPRFSSRVMGGAWTRGKWRSTGEEVRHGKAQIGLDHCAHMAARHRLIFPAWQQVGERPGRAIIIVLIAAQDQRRDCDLGDLRLRRVDEGVE